MRNPYSRFHPYHTSCPELSDLFEWCPPLLNRLPLEDEEGNLIGDGFVFDGWVPWRGDLDTRWDRERE